MTVESSPSGSHEQPTLTAEPAKALGKKKPSTEDFWVIIDEFAQISEEETRSDEKAARPERGVIASGSESSHSRANTQEGGSMGRLPHPGPTFHESWGSTGCTAISAEPNTRIRGPLFDDSTRRRILAESVRQSMSPSDLAALDSLGLTEEATNHMLIMDQ